jgi:hypothetical protein
MKDAKGHGSDARNGSGQFQQTSTGISKIALERVKLRQLVDARKYLAARTSNRGINPPAMYADSRLAGANTRMERTDMPVVSPHGRGIDNATAGKKLA